MWSPRVKPDAKFALGMSLLQKLCRETEGDNFAFSPLSLEIAFSMLVAGVGGGTKKQLLNLLGYANEADLHSMHAELIKDQRLPIKMANKCLVRNELEVRKSFATLVKEKYQSEVESVDFANDGKKVEAELNAWVALKTSDMIKQLLSPGALVSDTILVLLNAVYFKGTWAKEFDTVPHKMDFTLRNGSTVKKNFMTQESFDFKYCQTDKLKMVNIPYQEAECYMVVGLPTDESKHIDEVLATMTAAEMSSAVEKLNAVCRGTEVRLTMPKFRIDYKYGNLVKHMKALGVHKIFNGGDFGGLFGNSIAPVWVSSVVHQTVIEVDEFGTRAAAAAITCLCNSLPKHVDVNRPFVFMLGTAKQTPYFMGICAMPVN